MGRMTTAEDNPLVGIWVMDQEYQVVELLFRTDGRYQQETKSPAGEAQYYLTERGRYTIDGETLVLALYEYANDPAGKRYYAMELVGTSLKLVAVDTEATYEYQFKPGSRADVLQRQGVERVLVGTWWRPFPYSGLEQYTFRPGGYYFLETIDESSDPPIQYIRGRFVENDTGSIVKPYGGVEAKYELDFFGDTLTLILLDSYYGASTAYFYRPGSRETVQAKADEAAVFLSQDNWHVGVWEIRDVMHTMDLTIRPDGHYIARVSISRTGHLHAQQCRLRQVRMETRARLLRWRASAHRPRGVFAIRNAGPKTAGK